MSAPKYQIMFYISDRIVEAEHVLKFAEMCRKLETEQICTSGFFSDWLAITSYRGIANTHFLLMFHPKIVLNTGMCASKYQIICIYWGGGSKRLSAIHALTEAARRRKKFCRSMLLGRLSSCWESRPTFRTSIAAF